MEAVLEATSRDSFGKNEARRTRRAGRVPAVVYGASAECGSRAVSPIAVDPRALLKILHSESGAITLISLKLGGGGDARVLIRDYQLDPVTHAVLHADFYRVRMDKTIHVTIPVTVKGEPKGVKQQGGLLEFIRREIEVECLPADIPEHVEVDVSELMLHQGVRVRDIAAADAKWKARSDPDMMLVHVILPKAEEVAATPEATAAVATATPAEPEVIKKGKKDEEEEEKKDDKKKDDRKK